MLKYATFLWGVMSESFVKLIRSDEMRYLARKYHNAFILLTFIAERARRENGCADGLLAGECHIGDYKEYGLTEKEYRNAKKILVERNHIEIIETCRTRKNEKNSKSTLNLQNREKWPYERATKVTTIGTLVKIISRTIYDINSEDDNQQKGDRKGDRGATEGRPKGDEQEGIRKNKKEKEYKQPLTPSSFSLPSKIKFRELVELTQEEYDSLLAKNGQEFLNLMLDTLDAYKGSTGKKYDSDFHTMKQGGWVVNRVKKDLQEQKTADEKTNKPARGGKPSNNPKPSETQFQPGRVLRGSNTGQVDKGGSNE